DLALGSLFEYDRGGRTRPAHVQVVTAVEEESGSVAAVELDEVVTAGYVPRVIGDSDDEVEDDVVCEKVEEVVSVRETLQTLLYDAEERVQGTKVFNAPYQ